MRLTHDDRMRALRARQAPAERSSDLEDLSSTSPPPPPGAAQITPARVNRARAITAPALRHGFPSRFATGLPPGRMAAFLRHARSVQRLPSIGRSMRE
jgi:hypothetical protein